VITVLITEGIRHPEPDLHGLTVIVGGLAFVACIGCTWLGNVRSLRRSAEG
jgi:hypothetical protein